MEKYISKARVLIEALPYIQLFSGKTVVIKFGGSIMDRESSMRAVLQDIVFMKYAGWKPVIVHGGGPAINEALRERQLKAQFIDGLRVTDQITMDLVEDILGNRINSHIVNILDSLQVQARGMNGKKDGFIKVDPQHPDLGYVGNIRSIDPTMITELLDAGIIPVIAPIGIGDDRHAYNINADTAAAEIAASLGARKLVFLTDTPGILGNPEDSDSLISSLDRDSAASMMNEGRISGGMIPKVTSGLKALSFGVNKVHIIDGRIDHSLLLEIFTKKGIGTEILKTH